MKSLVASSLLRSLKSCRFAPAAFGVAAVSASLAYGQATAPAVAEQSSITERIDYDIKYLASDELEGREPGSEGIETAAQYIIDEFKESGVASGAGDNFRQDFSVSLGIDVDTQTSKLMISLGESEESGEMNLQIDNDFRPLLVGAPGEVESAELVFVGYAISDEDNNYDEFANVDLDGKVAVFLRMEPQQDDANSVFDGLDTSRNASISRKFSLCAEAGAAAVIMVNDSGRANDDQLATISLFGPAIENIPFFQMTRKSMDALLQACPLKTATGEALDSLTEVEKLIDTKLEPVSQAFAGCTISCGSSFSERSVTTSNIVGVVEGEGPHADETILIGGHYDHLGWGGYGSNAPGRHEIHNGADDNATGTAGVVELARRFAESSEKPGRRLVFVAFSGEERGLLGSAYYVENPLYPLENTVAMINYDMIGRLREDKLTIFGTGTAEIFDKALEEANATEAPLVLDKQPSPFAGSDHMPFVQKDIPVMFLHTGLTDIYHTPEDDYETLNIEGAVRVIDYTERLIRVLADAEDKPVYQEFAPRRRSRAWLGVRFDYDGDERGATVEEMPEGSPAIEAGLEVGDIVTALNGQAIEDASALREILGELEPGDEVEVQLVRGDEEKTIQLEVGTTPRRRRGRNE